ncbi:hypothetical protein [Streptomyces sp. G2]|uniref:hypothetical protein n=1 Tax=Streptomyces sp. G2 TaxID=1684471 RepID=UPI00202E43DC|nr:hypothetical protein [Streptomyces sp. G2]
MRPCGRPTKSGNPCRAQFSGRGFACKLHTTDHEKTLIEAFEHGRRTGREEERTWQQRSANTRIEQLERQVRTLEEKLDSRDRRYEVDGHQAVTVDGYAYVWTGQGRLEVGDTVLLPENYVSALRRGPGPFPETVTQLGTTYSGTHSRIIAKAPADD